VNAPIAAFVSRAPLASLVPLVLLVASFCACEQKSDAPRGSGTSGATRPSGVGVVNGGLASVEGGALETAKSSLVAQQCALACGVRPENDPGLCTQRCAKECLGATDIAGIDACAQRIANP
jgi:hypothetical protein